MSSAIPTTGAHSARVAASPPRVAEPVADPRQRPGGAGALSAPPAAGAPATWDAARAIELIGAPPHPRRELTQLERTLRDGVVLARREDRNEGGMNGRLELARVATEAGTPRIAVVKQRNEQAAQEMFVYRLARELGVDQHFPAVARRQSGAAFSQYLRAPEHADPRPGRVEAVLADGAGRRGLTPADAKDAAAIELSLLRFIDYLTANSDRRPANTLADSQRGKVWWIDNGLVGNGDLPQRPAQLHSLALKPFLESWYLGVEPGERQRVQLHPGAVAIIRERLTPDVLERLHASMLRDVDLTPMESTKIDAYRSAVQAKMVQWVASPEFLGNMQARREHAVRTGSFDFRQIT